MRLRDAALPGLVPRPRRDRGLVAHARRAPTAPALPPTRANGQLALGIYLRDPQAGGYRPICLDVLAVKDERISEVIAFRSPRSFARFGLPEELPLDEPSP